MPLQFSNCHRLELVFVAVSFVVSKSVRLVNEAMQNFLVPQKSEKICRTSCSGGNTFASLFSFERLRIWLGRNRNISCRDDGSRRNFNVLPLAWVVRIINVFYFWGSIFFFLNVTSTKSSVKRFSMPPLTSPFTELPSSSILVPSTP